MSTSCDYYFGKLDSKLYKSHYVLLILNNMVTLAYIVSGTWFVYKLHYFSKTNNEIIFTHASIVLSKTNCSQNKLVGLDNLFNSSLTFKCKHYTYFIVCTSLTITEICIVNSKYENLPVDCNIISASINTISHMNTSILIYLCTNIFNFD